MSAYYDKSYEERMKDAGSMAEGAFMKYADEKGWSYRAYGFDSGLEDYFKVPEFIRVTPDFLVTKPKQALIECKGLGRDGIVKIKHDYLESLQEWQGHLQVVFFFYDSYKKEFAFSTYSDIWSKIHDGRNVDISHFPDNGRKFYGFHKVLFTWQDS